MSLIYFISVVTLIHLTGSTQLPPEFKTCDTKQPGLNECLEVAIEDAIHFMKDGSKSLAIPPLDPLRVDSLFIDGGNKPVSLNLKLLNLDVYGFSALDLTHVETDPDIRELQISVHVPVVTILSDYEMDGKVMVLPIKGKGRCNITLEEVISNFDVTTQTYEKEGKPFIKIDGFSFPFGCKRMYFNFENLFNGDKALGANVNKMMNDNWDIVSEELQPSFSEALSMIAEELAERIFSRVAKRDIFH